VAAKKSGRRIWKIILAIVGVCVIVGGVFGYSYYKKIYYPNISAGGQNEYLLIPTGSSYEDVLNILKKENILLDAGSFEWLAELKKYPSNVHPGRYKIHDGMSNNELVNLLRSGEQEPVDLVIHGVRTKYELAGKIGGVIEADSSEIIELLTNPDVADQYGFNKHNFMVMIIPNTYEFYWNTSGEEFLKRMASEYKAYWNEDRKSKAAHAGLSQSEVAVLASIVQQETVKPAEMPTIAGVYINRLNKGMLLQADPTVVFAVGDFTLKRVLHKHLEYDSPYNTYMYAGLPPGPICLATTITMDAVLNYEKHKYIFFCAKEDFSGYHNFAETNAEHERNARKYREALNKRKIK
jgi:UPF0755 protein